MIIEKIGSVALLLLIVTNFFRPIPKNIPRKLFYFSNVVTLGLLLFKVYQYYFYNISPYISKDIFLLIVGALFCMKIRGLQKEEYENREEKKWWWNYL